MFKYTSELRADELGISRLPCHKFTEIFGQNCAKLCILLETFFSAGNQFFLFYNFNTATDGRLKNRIFEYFF
jgi:hypothetical protein